jgi:hypothetical protein
LSPEPVRHEPLSWLTDRSVSADESPLLQERLSLLGLVTTGISAAFYAVGVGLDALGIEPLSPAAHAGFLALLVVTSGTWLYCRGPRRSEARLRAVDLLVVMALTPLSLLVCAETIPERDVRLMVMLLAVNLLLFARSIFVPSSARRSFLSSAAALCPWPSTCSPPKRLCGSPCGR